MCLTACHSRVACREASKRHRAIGPEPDEHHVAGGGDHLGRGLLVTDTGQLGRRVVRPSIYLGQEMICMTQIIVLVIVKLASCLERGYHSFCVMSICHIISSAFELSTSTENNNVYMSQLICI